MKECMAKNSLCWSYSSWVGWKIRPPCYLLESYRWYFSDNGWCWSQTSIRLDQSLVFEGLRPQAPTFILNTSLPCIFRLLDTTFQEQKKQSRCHSHFKVTWSISIVIWHWHIARSLTGSVAPGWKNLEWHLTDCVIKAFSMQIPGLWVSSVCRVHSSGEARRPVSSCRPVSDGRFALSLRNLDS